MKCTFRRLEKPVLVAFYFGKVSRLSSESWSFLQLIGFWRALKYVVIMRQENEILFLLPRPTVVLVVVLTRLAGNQQRSAWWSVGTISVNGCSQRLPRRSVVYVKQEKSVKTHKQKIIELEMLQAFFPNMIQVESQYKLQWKRNNPFYVFCPQTTHYYSPVSKLQCRTERSVGKHPKRHPFWKKIMRSLRTDENVPCFRLIAAIFFSLSTCFRIRQSYLGRDWAS